MVAVITPFLPLILTVLGGLWTAVALPWIQARTKQIISDNNLQGMTIIESAVEDSVNTIGAQFGDLLKQYSSDGVITDAEWDDLKSKLSQAAINRVNTLITNPTALAALTKLGADGIQLLIRKYVDNRSQVLADQTAYQTKMIANEVKEHDDREAAIAAVTPIAAPAAPVITTAKASVKFLSDDKQIKLRQLLEALSDELNS